MDKIEHRAIFALNGVTEMHRSLFRQVLEDGFDCNTLSVHDVCELLRRPDYLALSISFGYRQVKSHNLVMS
jgi:hypothetical protein